MVVVGSRSQRTSRVCVLALGLILVFPLSTVAFTGDITNDPSKLVEKYLSLDSRGARLDAQSFEVLTPYTAWKEEPVWGRVVVISKYEVIGDVTQWQIISSMEAFIPVTFQVVGIMYWETATFLPESYVELRHFQVKAVDNQWRIVAPQLPPHVGRRRLLDFVRLGRLQEADESRKVALQALEEQLGQVH